jgi:hypothetical protein
MRYSLLLSLAIALFLLSGCGGPDRKARADAICDCLKPLERLNLALAGSIAQGETEAVTDLLLEITREAGAARTCLQEHKVAAESALRSDAALVTLLDQQCPYWAGLLGALPPE